MASVDPPASLTVVICRSGRWGSGTTLNDALAALETPPEGSAMLRFEWESPEAQRHHQEHYPRTIDELGRPVVRVSKTGDLCYPMGARKRSLGRFFFPLHDL